MEPTLEQKDKDVQGRHRVCAQILEVKEVYHEFEGDTEQRRL